METTTASSMHDPHKPPRARDPHVRHVRLRPSQRVPLAQSVDHDAHVDNSPLSVAKLLLEDAFNDYAPLLPAALLEVPKVPGGRGHRIRVRHKLNRDIALCANDIMSSLNDLDSGLRTTRALRRARSTFYTSATRSLHRRVMKLAALTVSARHDPALVGVTGAQCISHLLKADRVDRYSFSMKAHCQVPMVAQALDEPPPRGPTVDMLSALPWSESLFYAEERNVVELAGKSEVLYHELQDRFGFVGGDYSNYVEYFNRTDIDSTLWSWSDVSGIKCVNGFSVVPNKDPAKQRKLLMTCAANYLWSDARSRSELGMQGGGGLATTYAADGQACISGWDQSNAFTCVRTPPWFWQWMAVPPVRASDVWRCLPQAFRSTITRGTWVFPRYTRLAMGSTHSVHILMSINLEVVGRTLQYSARLASRCVPADNVQSSKIDALCEEKCVIAGPSLDDPDADVEEDRLWAEAHHAKRMASRCWVNDVFKPKTLQAFLSAAEVAKRSHERVFVVAHLFSGARRPGDLEHHLRDQAAALGLKILIISVDLGADLQWDLSEPATFHALHDAILRGLIDAVVGGAPCATWSRSRFRPDGPRPLRFRDQLWGRSDLTAFEHDRIVEANVLIVNFTALCESCAMRGGLFIKEHPEDPGVAPFPSFWITDAYKKFALRTGARLTSLDQCALGAETQKPTSLSNNVPGFPLEGPRCPGNHQHGRAIGKTSDGRFRSRRLAAYPSQFCSWLASKLVAVFVEWNATGVGPTGWLKRVAVPDRSFLHDVEQTKKC